MRKCKLGLLFCAVLLFLVGCPIIFPEFESWSVILKKSNSGSIE